MKLLLLILSFLLLPSLSDAYINNWQNGAVLPSSDLPVAMDLITPAPFGYQVCAGSTLNGTDLGCTNIKTSNFRFLFNMPLDGRTIYVEERVYTDSTTYTIHDIRTLIGGNKSTEFSQIASFVIGGITALAFALMCSSRLT